MWLCPHIPCLDIPDNRHLTCNTAQDAYVNISRGLARSLLFKHLQTLDIALHTFKSLQDPEWLTYHRLAKVSDLLSVRITKDRSYAYAANVRHDK